MANSSQARINNQFLNEIVMAIMDKTGNHVGAKQIAMIESRFAKRLLDLGLENVDQYLHHYRKNQAAEIEALTSLLTVHHTYFFREYGHFEFLETSALVQLVERLRLEGKKTLRIWSAACSRGQEVYSIAMTVDAHLQAHAPDLSFEIVATDVDPASVKFANNGVYPWTEVKEIPAALMQKYWVRGSGDIAQFAKIKDSLKSRCKFQVCNLMDLASTAPAGEFDIIFCRNVFIYFSEANVERIIGDLRKKLNAKSSFLFVGLSESMVNVPKGFKRSGPAIYAMQTPEATSSVRSNTPHATSSITNLQKQVGQAVPPVGDVPIRVLCVDDSPTILTLLKKILVKQLGFEVVATAANGLEAAVILESGLPVDLVTLDIHMPVMTGIEYLEKHFRAGHVPVVMLTSASRDNLDLAHRALELGAVDYIEKPSLGNLNARADEIRAKLKLAARNNKAQARPTASDLGLERAFKRSFNVQEPEKKIRIVVCERKQFSKLELLMNETKDSDPTTLVVVNPIGSDSKGSEVLLEFRKTLSKPTIASLRSWEPGMALTKTGIYFCSLNEFLRRTREIDREAISFMFLNEIDLLTWKQFPTTRQTQIILEEGLPTTPFIRELAQVTVVPHTSFTYTAHEFFANTKLKVAS